MDGDNITREGLILRIWARTRVSNDAQLDINSVVTDIRRIAAAVDNMAVASERPTTSGEVAAVGNKGAVAASKSSTTTSARPLASSLPRP